MKGELLQIDGSHLTLDCTGCNPEILTDEKRIAIFMDELVGFLGMRKLIEPVSVTCGESDNGWDNGGVSAFVIIAESHISIHTFPQAALLTADVYSCKPFDTEAAIAKFKAYFGATHITTNLISRKVQNLREGQLAFSNQQN